MMSFSQQLIGGLGRGTNVLAQRPRTLLGWNTVDAHSTIVLSNQNTKVVRDNSASDFVSVASLSVSGKVYWEVTDIDGDTIIGIANETVSTANTSNFIASGFWGYRRTGATYTAGTITTGFESGNNYETYRFWFDSATGNMWVAINDGAPIGGGDPIAGTSPTITGITGTTFRVLLDTREKTLASHVRFSAHTWEYGPESTSGNTFASTYTSVGGDTALSIANALPKASANEVYLFWFAGQSNVLGGDDQELSANGGANLTAAELSTYPQIQNWVTSSYLDFTLADNYGNQVPHGPDIFLIQQQRELCFHNRPIYRVQTAVGGTAIAEFLPGGFFEPTMITKATAAINSLVSAGKTVIPYFIWHQGESDYNNHATYAANLASLLFHVRSTVSAGGTGTMPALVGELWDRPTYNGDFPNITLLNAAIKSTVEADSNAYLIPTKDLATYDLVHFSSKAQIEFGRMLADCIRHIPNTCRITSTI